MEQVEGPDNSKLWKEKKWLEDEIARLRKVLEDLLAQIAAARGQLKEKKKVSGCAFFTTVFVSNYSVVQQFIPLA